jgi:hypothetical protein
MQFDVSRNLRVGLLSIRFPFRFLGRKKLPFLLSSIHSKTISRMMTSSCLSLRLVADWQVADSLHGATFIVEKLTVAHLNSEFPEGAESRA